MDTESANVPEPEKGRPLWLKIAGVGCVIVIVLILIAGGLVASNWSRLTGYVEKAKTAMTQLMTVQAAVANKYKAEVRVTIKSQTGVQGSMLSVTLVNPPLMDQVKIDGPDGRQAALEVAATVRDALPPDGGYDNYEVVFQRDGGTAGVVMTGGWTFRFVASDLPPAKGASGG